MNTVRTHIRNVLRKLAAWRRNEAVRRARDLGIPGLGDGPCPSFVTIELSTP